MTQSAANIKSRAFELGFDIVGIIPAEPSPTLDAYERWVAQGLHGTMGYMARPDRISRRRDLNVIVPGIRSMIVLAVDYANFVPGDVLHDPSRGRIAAYAWKLDYHDVLLQQLDALADFVQRESSQSLGQRAYVDTGAILERSHGQQAGLGFIGKNTMLINPRRGSQFFIGEVLTTAEFDYYDQPHRATMCGSCTRCLNACPTDAFPKPYVLDARRCISYHTIENKGWVDRDLRANFGNWIYGCDVCQDVCPFQRFARPTRQAGFVPDDLTSVAPYLRDILALDETTFARRYAGSPIKRIRRERLVRNACIAAGNSDDDALSADLTRLLSDESALVRGHAAWAFSHLLGNASHSRLQQQLDHEHDPQVIAEIEAALG